MTDVASHLRLTLQAERTPLPLDALRVKIEEFAAHDSWTRAELVAFQKDRLKAVLSQAVSRSPYYAWTIGPLVAQGAALHELPVLTKSQFMAHFDEIVTDRRLTRKMIECHIDGSDAGKLLLGEYRAAATGGTSGERGVFVYSDEAWLSVMAIIGRIQRSLGIAATTRSVGIGAPSPIHLSNRFYIESRALRPSSPRLDLAMPLEEVVAALNAYQPEAINTYPSFIRALAHEQQAGRLRISPRILRSGAEMLLPEVDQLAQATWGIPVYDGYASTEAGMMASQCRYRDGMHVAEDHVILEALDGEGKRLPFGAESAMCAITTLNNDVLPLIRYVLNDEVILTDEPCQCGLPSIRIASIKGRREESLSFPARNGETVSLRAIAFRSPLIALKGVRQFQILHGERVLKIAVALEKDAIEASVRSRIECVIQEIFASHEVVAPKVEVQVVESIARTGSGAKEKHFVGNA